MTVTNKIKGAMNLKGVGLQALAQQLDMRPQTLSNKFYKNSYSVADLVKISAAIGFEVCLIDGTQKIVIDLSDLQK